MLEVNYGIIGVGKTYHAVVNTIISSLQQGYRVFTNIKLDYDYIREIHGDIVDFVYYMTDFKGVVPCDGAVFVIDEFTHTKLSLSYFKCFKQNKDSHVLILSQRYKHGDLPLSDFNYHITRFNFFGFKGYMSTKRFFPYLFKSENFKMFLS